MHIAFFTHNKRCRKRYPLCSPYGTQVNDISLSAVWGVFLCIAITPVSSTLVQKGSKFFCYHLKLGQIVSFKGVFFIKRYKHILFHIAIACHIILLTACGSVLLDSVNKLEPAPSPQPVTDRDDRRNEMRPDAAQEDSQDDAQDSKKAPENKPPRNKAPENKVLENKVLENKVPEIKAPEIVLEPTNEQRYRAGYLILSAVYSYIELPEIMRDEHFKEYWISSVNNAIVNVPESQKATFQLLVAYLEDDLLEKASFIYNSLYSNFEEYADEGKPLNELKFSFRNPLTDLDPQAVEDRIVRQVLEEWGDDERMAAYEMNRQSEAYLSLLDITIESDQQLQIFKFAMNRWESDYAMILYEYDSQMEALASLSLFLDNGGELMVSVVHYATKEWAPDYRMALYEFERQAEAVIEIGHILKSGDVDVRKMQQATDKWGEDYAMVLYEYEN